MALVAQRPARQDFDVQSGQSWTVSFACTGATVTAGTVALYRSAGVEYTGVTPAINTAGSTIEVAFTDANLDTLQGLTAANKASVLIYTVSGMVDGDGPFDLVTGRLSVHPEGALPSGSQSSSAALSVLVGETTVSVSVALGGSGGALVAAEAAARAAADTVLQGQLDALPSNYLSLAAAAAGFQPLDADLTALAAAGNSAVLAAATASFTTAQETKLAGIEAGATGDQTAAEILAALLTVDGAGSGLDADLLDGQSSAAFLTVAAAASGYQPLDSDLTALAALTTTAYGRAFLELANQAAVMALLSASSATAQGIVELATDAETITGTDTARATTPANIAAKLANYQTNTLDAAYQPLDSDLTAIAALTTTSYGRAFLSLANQAALVALLPSYQPLDTDLTALAALVSAADKLPYSTGAGTWSLADFTAAGRALVDDADSTAQRTTLGLGSIATQAASTVAITGGSITGITDLAVADGGTGASTAATARTNLGAAASAMTISTTAPLTGGGDLSANRTLAIDTATNAAVGAVRLSTDAESRTGTSTSTALTPAAARLSLATKWSQFTPIRPDLTRAMKVMASPPTVGALATSSAIASGVRVQPGLMGTVVDYIESSGRFTWLGGNVREYGTSSPDDNYYQMLQNTDPFVSTNTPGAVEFLFDGTNIELLFKGLSTTVWVSVDGEYVSSTPITVTATGSQYYLPLTFASRAWRRIRFEAFNGIFGGVYTGPNDTIVAAPRNTIDPTVCIMGDSFSEPSGSGGGNRAWWRTMGDILGWRDVRGLAQGGTGYVQTGTGGRLAFGSRVTSDILPYSPDIVIFAGGYNDIAQSTATITANATSCIQAIQASLPNTLIFVLSPFVSDGVDNISLAQWGVRDAVKSAATATGVTFLDVMELPLTATAQTGTLNAAYASGTSVQLGGSSTFIPRGATINIGGYRRVVTTVSSWSPYTATLSSALGAAQSNGTAWTEVGPCLWTGTGQVGTTTGSGNCDLYVYSDGVHPTRAGCDAIGVTVAGLIARALNPA